MIYLDHAATTPLSARALEAMLPVLRDDFGNPSGLHGIAQRAAEHLEGARQRVASCLGARYSDEIVFTSGGTEANNLALLGLCRAAGAGRRAGLLKARRERPHLLASAIEHKSVLAPLHRLEKEGWEIELWQPDERGHFSPESLAQRLRATTHLVTVGLANNELGIVQPIAELVKVAHQGGALFHCDGVAAVGKLPIQLLELGVDSLSMSAHKFYGPKGSGALYARLPTSLTPVLWGGGQEGGLRSGTQNVAGAVGLAEALAESCQLLEGEAVRLEALRDALWARLQGLHPSCLNLTEGLPHLPNTLSLVVPGVHGETLALEMNLQGVALSSGSACSSLTPGPSHVLRALGLAPELQHSHLRFSLGRSNGEEQIEAIAQAFQQALQRQKVAR